MTKKTFAWVLHRIRSRVPAMLVLVCAHIASALLMVGFALGSKQIIDCAVSRDANGFWQACMMQGGVILGILLLLFLQGHLKERLLADMDRDWKKSLLHGLLHGDFQAVSQYHSGELLNRLNEDVRVLDENILTLLPSLASMVTKLVAAMAVLATLEPLLSLTVVTVGVIVVLLTGLLRRRLKDISMSVSEHNGKVSGFLQETLEKLLMVQAMDVSGEIEHRADGLLDTRYHVLRKRKNISLLANICINIMGYGAGFVALVWGACGILAGTMTYGTLMAITQLVSQLQSPFLNLSGIIPKYAAIGAAAERLMELETLCGEPVPAREQASELYQQMTAIGARELCFAYDRDPVFDGADFRLPKGEFGVITGHSGIGKSTLLKLMLGIFHPDSGQLFVETPQGPVILDRATRRLFAYVPQGNLLLSGTLRENLTITRPEATDAEIYQAIHMSAMDDYLSSLPKGLETVIGESGAGLSEGQAQRLSIARAILSQAPVLLLDEATSALDADTERLVLQRLRDTGKTCIAVTHRPAAIELSHWSLDMQPGGCVFTHK